MLFARKISKIYKYFLKLRSLNNYSDYIVFTQGDPLAMIAYGIGVLPLICDLRRDHPRVMQMWYADNAGAGGKFRDVMAHFRDLQLRGSARGYFL